MLVGRVSVRFPMGVRMAVAVVVVPNDVSPNSHVAMPKGFASTIKDFASMELWTEGVALVMPARDAVCRCVRPFSTCTLHLTLKH